MRTHREHVRIAKVHADARPDLVERLGVTTTPTLLLLDERMHEVARLEGRQTLPAMRRAFEPFVLPEPVSTQEDMFAVAIS